MAFACRQIGVSPTVVSAVMLNMHDRHHTCPTSRASGRNVDFPIARQMAPKVQQSNGPVIELSHRSELRTCRQGGALTISKVKAREDNCRGDKD